MVKNYLFTMKSNNPRLLRKMLKEVMIRLGVETMEDTIIELVYRLFPAIAIKYYPNRWRTEVIRV